MTKTLIALAIMSFSLNAQSQSCEGYINCVKLYERMTNRKLNSNIINELNIPKTSERTIVNPTNKARFFINLNLTKGMLQNAKMKNIFHSAEDPSLEKIKEINGSCIMYSLKFSPPACTIVLARPKF